VTKLHIFYFYPYRDTYISKSKLKFYPFSPVHVIILQYATRARYKNLTCLCMTFIRTALPSHMTYRRVYKPALSEIPLSLSRQVFFWVSIPTFSKAQVRKYILKRALNNRKIYFNSMLVFLFLFLFLFLNLPRSYHLIIIGNIPGITSKCLSAIYHVPSISQITRNLITSP
jgi:asparagine N-glycosylation enzyme membrane subunit Stt3